MKRHPALEPFSRDHNQGLILSRALMMGRANAVSEAQALWTLELRDHFDEEVRLLAPLLPADLAERLRTEHAELAARFEGLPTDPDALGHGLEAHIRWEERELFPAIEATATDDQLAQLSEATDALEHRRWAHAPERERIVKAREARRITETG